MALRGKRLFMFFKRIRLVGNKFFEKVCLFLNRWISESLEIVDGNFAIKKWLEFRTFVIKLMIFGLIVPSI